MLVPHLMLMMMLPTRTVKNSASAASFHPDYYPLEDAAAEAAY
jgi:hypothetical protein